MRMRKKAWARPELSKCPFYIAEPGKRKAGWHQWFPAIQPIWLELGCGKCPFLARMGLLHPEVNLIGVDSSLDILGVARRTIVNAYAEANQPVDNIVLFAHNIEYIDEVLSAEDQVDRIYINFCNPWPKKKHQKRRLTYPRQLLLYRSILRDQGEIWFKTDDESLFLDSLDYFAQSGFSQLRLSYDLHREAWGENVLTEHEQMFSAKGVPIKAAVFRKEELPAEQEAALRQALRVRGNPPAEDPPCARNS